jgi:hypothetical protein
MKPNWLGVLCQRVERSPVVILRFGNDEWQRLRGSRTGLSEFTVARSHSLFDGVRVPTPCLMVGKDEDGKHLYFGLISSRSAVTTLETRIKVRRGVKIQPHSEAGLIRLVSEPRHAHTLAAKLRSRDLVVSLSPKLSQSLVEGLAKIERNQGGMRAVAESLTAPKYFRDAPALQEDAVRTALRAFGLAAGDRAITLDLVEGRDTALARIPILEDAVVEHDARHVPGYALVQSHLTGRAIFQRGEDLLEVYTANKRPLENVFGVDLIYLNSTRQNIVMLQYKMLERRPRGRSSDWIYRPDMQLESEIRRMCRFSAELTPSPHEYRLNPAVFYLKFVKRNASITKGGIIVPIDHFAKLREDPACRGPRGGLRLSYETLRGRYLREGPFLDLIRAGYIGGYAETTGHLKALVDAVVSNNRAVVAAIQASNENPGRTAKLEENDFDLDDLWGDRGTDFP